jgi:hypothetical protein
MSRFIVFFQSKVALAIIGTVLFGGGAALVAAAPFTITNHAATKQAQNYTEISANGNETATPTTPTPGKSPTATPTPRPPTPTAGSAQIITLHGTVGTINTGAGTFTIKLGGGSTKTVRVTSQTTFQGDATSLSGIHSGWHVDVQGVYQANGTFTAYSINAHAADN